MTKLFAWVLIFCFLTVTLGCANEKTVCIPVQTATHKVMTDTKIGCYTFKPVGLINMDDRNPDVNYNLSVGNIVWSTLFCYTIVVPVVLVGYYLWEPDQPKLTMPHIPGTR